MKAAQYSKVEAVILLLAAGADVNIKCNVSKRTSTYARVSMSVILYYK